MNPWTVTGGENVPRPKRNRKPGARPARRSFVPSESSISEEASESSSTLEAPEDIEHVANVYRITEDIEAGGGAGGEQVRLEEEFQDAPETPPRSNPSRNGSPKETTPALLPHAQNRWLCFHDENLERRYLAAFATADGYESFLIVSIIGCIGYAVIILSFLPSRTLGACAPHGGCPGTFWWPRALQVRVSPPLPLLLVNSVAVHCGGSKSLAQRRKLDCADSILWVGCCGCRLGHQVAHPQEKGVRECVPPVTCYPRAYPVCVRPCTSSAVRLSAGARRWCPTPRLSSWPPR